MSSEIYYDRAYIRVGDRFIPVVNHGSSNCFDFDACGREVPEKHWSVLNYTFHGRQLFTEEEIRQIAAIYEAANSDNRDGIRKSRNRSFDVGEFGRWIMNGMKTAHTMEEYRACGNTVVVVEYAEPVWKKHVVYTTKQLLDKLCELDGKPISVSFWDNRTVMHSFVSGLSEHTVKPPMADEILEYDGRYWTTSGKRLSYMRDKTQDERYFILTLFAIAKELEDTGRYSPVEQIQLAVGLPPEHYGVLKDKFARYFKRDGIIKFVYKDKPYSIMIDKVMVFPQAYAAVVPKSSMVVNMLRVFVVDIGGYTTDVLLLKNGKPDLQFCRSLETGIITMNNEIIRKVGALHDMRIEDEHISAVLSGQDTILPDDVKQTICGATKLHAQDILNQLRELQVDLRSNPAVFIGGGSLLLRPFLEASPLVAKADFVESPNANALGYEMLGRVQLSHRPA